MSADGGCALPGADIDGLIAASTAANARVVKLQGITDSMVAEMKQVFERHTQALDLDEQMLVDHEKFSDLLQDAANAGLGQLLNEADIEAGTCAEAVETAVHEIEGLVPRGAQ